MGPRPTDFQLNTQIYSASHFTALDICSFTEEEATVPQE